jgi:hypothetical protein
LSRFLGGFLPDAETQKVRMTHRWRGLDSNFQYAGAVNLVVASLMPPKAWNGVRPLSFRTARRPPSKRRGPDRRDRNPCGQRTAPNFCVVREENGNALPGDRARRSRPGARQPLVRSEGAAGGFPFIAVWKSDLVGSDIDRSMTFSGSALPTVAGALVSAER